MENLNTQSINQEGNNMSNIEVLFQEYLSNGGEPKVTAFRQHLNNLINKEIKQLCGRSSKSAGDDWRSEVNARFGGRGAKWVFVSLEEIKSTLDALDARGIDTADYRTFTEAHGQAWVRYTTARMHEGKKCAGFAILTDGSTINKPSQLHFIPVDELNERITPMTATPHSMKLEEKKIETEEVIEETIEEVVEVKGEDEGIEMFQEYDLESELEDDELASAF